MAHFVSYIMFQALLTSDACLPVELFFCVGKMLINISFFQFAPVRQHRSPFLFHFCGRDIYRERG